MPMHNVRPRSSRTMSSTRGEVASRQAVKVSDTATVDMLVGPHNGGVTGYRKVDVEVGPRPAAGSMSRSRCRGSSLTSPRLNRGARGQGRQVG
jgi:hypothetical protein